MLHPSLLLLHVRLSLNYCSTGEPLATRPCMNMLNKEQLIGTMFLQCHRFVIKNKKMEELNDINLKLKLKDLMIKRFSVTRNNRVTARHFYRQIITSRLWHVHTTSWYTGRNSKYYTKITRVLE